MALDAFTGDGSGGFTDTSTYQTVGQPDIGTVGLVAGDFQGRGNGLEVAVPDHQRRRLPPPTSRSCRSPAAASGAPA